MSQGVAVSVTRYVWAVNGTVAATGKRPGQPTYDPLALVQHLLGSRRGLDSYTDSSELGVGIQTRALEAFVVALKRDRKLKLLISLHLQYFSGD